MSVDFSIMWLVYALKILADFNDFSVVWSCVLAMHPFIDCLVVYVIYVQPIYTLSIDSEQHVKRLILMISYNRLDYWSGVLTEKVTAPIFYMTRLDIDTHPDSSIAVV